MKIELLCGQDRLPLDLPERATVLEMKDAPALSQPESRIAEALQTPIGSPSLSELARGKQNACIVISDFTRPVPNRILLPPLIETLTTAGIPVDRITILIATGMHRPNLGEELASLVGRRVMGTVPIVNHYCRKREELQKVDEIDGAPIEINTHYLNADLKILTGLIEPHFYAGYSGGGKAILPGISSFETMKFMHSYRMIDHPDVTNCKTVGNPFHEYVVRVSRLVGADFLLNVVINKDREVAGVFAGDVETAHRAGCDMVYRHSVAPVAAPADMVITSGGGYPLDATFYQVSKALICAKTILKHGGTIVVGCECREGLGGKEFSGIIRSICSPQEFFEGYCRPENLVIDQWCAQNIYQALDHAGQVYIYAPGLSKEDLQKTGAVKIQNVQQTVDDLLPSHENLVAVPDGPYVVGMLRQGQEA